MSKLANRCSFMMFYSGHLIPSFGAGIGTSLSGYSSGSGITTCSLRSSLAKLQYSATVAVHAGILCPKMPLQLYIRTACMPACSQTSAWAWLKRVKSGSREKLKSPKMIERGFRRKRLVSRFCACRG